jgi:hypothetical protein
LDVTYPAAFLSAGSTVDVDALLMSVVFPLVSIFTGTVPTPSDMLFTSGYTGWRYTEGYADDQHTDGYPGRRITDGYADEQHTDGYDGHRDTGGLHP